MGSYAKYSGLGGGSGGGGGGVTSINTLTGDVVLAAGTNVTLVPVGNTITINASGSGGGITSINTDTTAAQLIVAASTGTDFTIGTTSGTTTVAIPTASASARGLLSSADWSTFNAKQSALTFGNLTSTPTTNLVVSGGTGSVIGSGVSLALTGASLVETTSSVLTITGATNAVLGTGVSIQVKQASTSQSGYLSNTDWNTFNGKQASGNYITALTGDVTASGPGSSAASLVATTNATLTTLSGLTTAASLVTVGTITTGTWNATAIAIAHGGTGQTAKTAAYDALSPTTTLGDIEYNNGTNNVRLGGNTTTTPKVLTQTGTGSVSAAPIWVDPTTLVPVNLYLTPNVQSFLSGTGTYGLSYWFIVTSANATVGATYTNNSNTFIVARTISGATTLLCTSNGAPTSSGTLTKSGGTGDSTITFSAVRAPLYLDVKVVGGGGGGAGSGMGTPPAGGAGGTTTFGTSLITCTGGSGGVSASSGGIGGTAVATGLNGTIVSGSSGGAPFQVGSALVASGGGSGGPSPFGGAGGSSAGAAGLAAIANSGSGGGGGGSGAATANSGAGGGSGGYVDVEIINLSATYSYAIGAAGTAGTAGSSGNAGGVAGSGYIEVREFFQ